MEAHLIEQRHFDEEKKKIMHINDEITMKIPPIHA